MVWHAIPGLAIPGQIIQALVPALGLSSWFPDCHGWTPSRLMAKFFILEYQTFLYQNRSQVGGFFHMKIKDKRWVFDNVPDYSIRQKKRAFF
jgi:hypothetical protein